MKKYPRHPALRNAVHMGAALLLCTAALTVSHPLTAGAAIRSMDILACEEGEILTSPVIEAGSSVPAGGPGVQEETVAGRSGADKNPSASETTSSPSDSSLPGNLSASGDPSSSGDASDPASLDDTWFDDALFIGDSRLLIQQQYARLGAADYYCTVGMSVFNCYTQKASDRNFSNMPLRELMATRKYGKVIVSLGINEAGYPLESLMNAYTRFVGFVQETQPDAKIILQGVLAVSRKTAAREKYSSPDNLRKINSRIAALADGETIFYIDPNERFADSEGFLLDGLASDGCHLYEKYAPTWNEWLKEAIGKRNIPPAEREIDS